MGSSINQNIKGGTIGLLSGVLWGIDTVIIGLSLAMSPLKDLVITAPFISAFLHDAFSAFWLLIYIILSGNAKKVFREVKLSGSFLVAFAALLGGPVGMSGYVLSVKYLGSSYSSAISSMYPAVGAFFAYIFLKDKLKLLGFLGLGMAIGSTVIIGLTAGGEVLNLGFGILFALMCVVGWGLESVVISVGMKHEVTPLSAILIRQLVSSLIYGFIVMPFIRGYESISLIFQNPNALIIILTASLGGILSYTFYYMAIDLIGPTRAMGLNISYSAWTIIFGVFFGTPLSVKTLILAIIIIVGSIFTQDDPMSVFNFKR